MVNNQCYSWDVYLFDILEDGAGIKHRAINVLDKNSPGELHLQPYSLDVECPAKAHMLKSWLLD